MPFASPQGMHTEHAPVPTVPIAEWGSLAESLVSAALAQRRAEAVLVRAQAAYLDYLARRPHLHALSFSSLGDLAEEILQMRPRTSYERLRLHRLFVDCPDAEQAFLDGVLSTCQILALEPLLRRGGGPARWIEEARVLTVREIRRRVRDARPDEIATPPEGRRVSFESPLGFLIAWKQMMDLARRTLGRQATQYACIQAILDESDRALLEPLAKKPRKRRVAAASMKPRTHPTPPDAAIVRRARETLDLVADYQDLLADLVETGPPRDPSDAYDRLVQIHRLRAPQRILFTRLLRDLRDTRALPLLDFGSMAAFVEGALGLSERSARARMDEADLFADSPLLEQAYGRGEIGLAQAFMVHLLAGPCDVDAYLRRARSLTLRQFRREFALARLLWKTDPRLATRFRGPFPHPTLEGALRARLIERHGWTEKGIDRAMRERRIPRLDPDASIDPAENPTVMGRLELLLDMLVVATWDQPPKPEAALPSSARQMSARGRSTRISFWAPCEIAGDFHVAVANVRKRIDPRMEVWQAVAALFAPVYEEWCGRDPERRPTREAILERDQYQCQFPGCSRRCQLEAHHPKQRSHGGRDTAENLVTLCHTHHQEIIHEGHASVSGKAVQDLGWKLGLRPGRPPLLELKGEKYVVGPWDRPRLRDGGSYDPAGTSDSRGPGATFLKG